jgi:LPXTG-motif cell wall-anchored protein
VPSAGAARPRLAATGAEYGTTILAGGLLLAVGCGLVFAQSRRRRGALHRL